MCKSDLEECGLPVYEPPKVSKEEAPKKKKTSKK
jgi:hypothetical protein